MANSQVANKDYFTKVVAATENYLGPASERFIRRQIEFHLEKEPQELTKSDMDRLASSVEIALGLLVNDKSVVSKAVAEIKNIK